MSARYAPLPNPHTYPDAIDEMEAAFDDSDDEDDQPHAVTSRNGYHSLPNAELSYDHGNVAAAPRAYNFEDNEFDYIRPPPGSPPGPSTRALPNSFGNSNGLVPSSLSISTDAITRGQGWLRRAAASVLPSHYVERLGLNLGRPQGPIGGGTTNDGVFANVTAKPSRQIRVQEGDEVYYVPEEVQKEVPPSYAQAQADAVPPYWETTIHAPSTATTAGDVIVDSLPTGSIFSFLWNMLVSISFQFVGFLLTYLLHTTHAAKLGSRAGLGITLIQYGFALRDRVGASGEQDVWAAWKSEEPRPTFSTAAEAEAYYQNLNSTEGGYTDATPTVPDSVYTIGDATSEWLSFLLMTTGWFILLTSLLGFWRVKRWERGIISSQEISNPPATPEERARSAAIVCSIERVFGLQGLSDGSLLRTGLGLQASQHDAEMEHVPDDDNVHLPNSYILPLEPSDPDSTERIARAYADEARLHQDLRSAGLL